MSGEISTRNELFGFFVFALLALGFLSPLSALAQVAEVVPQKSARQTLGSSACEKCHKPQNEWWPKNNHYETAEPFFDQKGKHVKIARLYGINPSDMTKGNILCMRCHGTIVSGSEKDSVTDGVGCEACHGPAKDYIKPHQEGEKALGDSRPGRLKGLELGMVNLRDLKTRAKNCGRCHNISEARLISAGHPSASNFFDYFVEGMAKTRHWTRPLDSADTLGKAHHEAFPATGRAEPKESAPAVAAPPPVVPQTSADIVTPKEPTNGQVAPAEGTTPAPTVPIPEAKQGPSSPPLAVASPKPLPPPPPPVPRPVPPVPIQSNPSADTKEDVPRPPLPKIDKSTSIEEILLIVKERLDLLYHAVHKEP